MSAEHRRFQRILTQRFGGCVVTMHTPHVKNALLADISVGGLKLMLAEPHTALPAGTAVKGEIHNENPAFHLAFAGQIAWSRESQLPGDMSTVVGVQFADYTTLPDALMNLVEVYDD